MLWVLNFWTEAGANLYRHRATGALIPIAFNPAAAKAMYARLGARANDVRNWDREAPGVDAAVIDTLARDLRLCRQHARQCPATQRRRNDRPRAGRHHGDRAASQ